MKTSEILQSVLAVGKYLACNPQKPITNADRIREMTDEEMATVIRDHRCNVCEWWFGTCPDEEKCKDEVLMWLKGENE